MEDLLEAIVHLSSSLANPSEASELVEQAVDWLDGEKRQGYLTEVRRMSRTVA